MQNLTVNTRFMLPQKNVKMKPIGLAKIAFLAYSSCLCLSIQLYSYCFLSLLCHVSVGFAIISSPPPPPPPPQASTLLQTCHLFGSMEKKAGALKT